MDEEEKPNHAGWVAAVFVAVLLYVLSVGPAVLLSIKTGDGGRSIRIFYAPVIWLHENTPLKKPIEAYLFLWGVH